MLPFNLVPPHLVDGYKVPIGVTIKVSNSMRKSTIKKGDDDHESTVSNFNMPSGGKDSATLQLNRLTEGKYVLTTHLLTLSLSLHYSER